MNSVDCCFCVLAAPSFQCKDEASSVHLVQFNNVKDEERRVQHENEKSYMKEKSASALAACTCCTIDALAMLLQAGMLARS